MSETTKYNNSTFEEIKHIDSDGVEYWLARELQDALGYVQWRRFSDVIEKAKVACEKSGISASLHFADVGKSSPMPNGGAREIDDVMLTRYACYLIAQNGDPRYDA